MKRQTEKQQSTRKRGKMKTINLQHERWIFMIIKEKQLSCEKKEKAMEIVGQLLSSRDLGGHPATEEAQKPKL